MTSMQLWLRLPDEVPYHAGGTVRATGSTNYSARLKVRQGWADEVRAVELRSRYEVKKFVPTVVPSRGAWR